MRDEEPRHMTVEESKRKAHELIEEGQWLLVAVAEKDPDHFVLEVACSEAMPNVTDERVLSCVLRALTGEARGPRLGT